MAVVHFTDGETEAPGIVGSYSKNPDLLSGTWAESVFSRYRSRTLWGGVEGVVSQPPKYGKVAGSCIVLALFEAVSGKPVDTLEPVELATPSSGRSGLSPPNSDTTPHPSWELCTRKAVLWKASTRSSASWVASLLTSSGASPLPLPRPWRIPRVTLAGKVRHWALGRPWVGVLKGFPPHTSPSCYHRDPECQGLQEAMPTGHPHPE